jgi:hypothetical protein
MIQFLTNIYELVYSLNFFTLDLPDQGLPLPNPMVIHQSEADEIEAFANVPAPGASMQADPSIKPGGSKKGEKTSSI